MDAGTLYQLRNVINRRNITKDPSSNVSACEDFFLTTVHAHVLSACMTVFGMKSVKDRPAEKFFPRKTEKCDSLHRRRVLLDAINFVMDRYVDFSMEDEDRGEDKGKRGKGRKDQDTKDHVCEYAQDVLTMGLMYMEFVDAIREGDGGRILRCWQYLLLIFKATGRRNYSVEAFNLLAQYKFIFTERMRMQLLWSRTINVHGRPGKNVSCDLHMEHLNRELKGSISGLGANITDGSIQRVGRSLRTSTKILENFDEQNDIASYSGHHPIRTSAADMEKLLKQVHEDSQVFTHRPGRRHQNFPDFEANVMKKLSKTKLMSWMQERLQQLLTYH